MKPTLAKVETLYTRENYKQSVQRHLNEASEHINNSTPTVLVVFAVGYEGLSYHSLSECSTLELLGAIEVLKTAIFLDHEEN